MVDAGHRADTGALVDAIVDGGPATGEWTNATANLAGLNSECGNLTSMSSVPDRDEVIAAVSLHGLWSSARDDSDWVPMGQAQGSAAITNRASSFVYDPDHPGTFWESGIYNGGGVYRTTDYGNSFSQLGSVTHCDAVSVDLTDPDRKTLLAGSHEQSGKLYRSVDGGQNWDDIGAQIPAGVGFSSIPLIIDSKVHLLGTYQATDAGVFRTTDGGASWTRVYMGGVRSPPVVDSHGTIYWLREQDAGLIKSTDHGVTWVQVTGPGLLSTYKAGASLILLPDEKLVSLGFDRLVMSPDQGTTWQMIGPTLPFAPQGVVYSAFRKELYIWQFDCRFDPGGDPVLPDAIERWGFDYQR